MEPKTDILKEDIFILADKPWLPLVARRESYEAVKPRLPKRESEALELLRRFHEGATAEEVAILAGKEPQFYRPRLTVMHQDGRISVIGRKKSERTGKSVSIYMALPEA